MPVDTSIYSSLQNPQAKDPFDTATKILTLKNLSSENQINNMRAAQAGQEFQDKQDLRDAYKQNTMDGPDGSPVVNMQGVMSSLGQKNPMAAQAFGLQMKSQQLDQMTKLHGAEKQLLFSIPVGSDASPDQKQAAWSQALDQGKKLGLPGIAHLSDQYPGDSFVRNAQMQSLTAEEHLAQANKQVEQGQKDQEISNKKQEMDLEREKFGYTKQFEANQQVQQAIESGRQAPDAQQELKDVLSAKKINEITSQAPDGNLNKLNNQQTKLAMMEVVKMAGGSVPTEGELESMTPENIAQKYGGLLQKVTNKSQAANAGEFLKQGIDYANGIADIGKQGLSSRANRIIEQRKSDLGPKNYQQYKEGVKNEFGDIAPKQAASGPKVISFDEWLSKQAGNK